MNRVFNDVSQPRQFSMAGPHPAADYGRQLMMEPSIVQDEAAYQYQSLPPRQGQGAGPWWTRQDEIVVPQTAPMLYSKQTVQHAGPAVTYARRELSPADQQIYRHYLEEGRPHDVIDENQDKRKRGKTGWSGMWRETKGPYATQQQQEVYAVEQPMVRQGYVTRAADADYISPYETHQVVSGPAQGGYYVGKPKKRGFFGF